MRWEDIKSRMSWSPWVPVASNYCNSTFPSLSPLFCSWNSVGLKRRKSNYFWPGSLSLVLTIQCLFRPSMPPSWQLEPRRCLSLQSSLNPSHRNKISWWWWAPSNLPKTKICLLDIQGWIQKARKKLKIHLSKRRQEQVSRGAPRFQQELPEEEEQRRNDQVRILQ